MLLAVHERGASGTAGIGLAAVFPNSSSILRAKSTAIVGRLSGAANPCQGRAGVLGVLYSVCAANP